MTADIDNGSLRWPDEPSRRNASCMSAPLVHGALAHVSVDDARSNRTDFSLRFSKMAEKPPRGRQPRNCIWTGGRWVNTVTMEVYHKKPPGPRGRPPKGYVWRDGQFVHAINQHPFEDWTHLQECRRAYYETQKCKYAANEGGRRDRKKAYLAIKRRLRGAPARPQKPPNRLLRSDDEKVAESSEKDTNEQTPRWCEHADTVPQL